MTGEVVSGGGTGRSGTGSVGDLLADIQLGHNDSDVANVLAQRLRRTVLAERLRRAGLEVRPEEVEGLAEEIENHASR